MSSAIQKCTNTQSKYVPLYNTYLTEISNNHCYLFAFSFFDKLHIVGFQYFTIPSIRPTLANRFQKPTKTKSGILTYDIISY
jgi:hypothetical protein